MQRQRHLGEGHPKTSGALRPPGKAQGVAHHLGHTRATQLLNTGAALAAIQNLPGHNRSKTARRSRKNKLGDLQLASWET